MTTDWHAHIVAFVEDLARRVYHDGQDMLPSLLLITPNGEILPINLMGLTDDPAIKSIARQILVEAVGLGAQAVAVVSERHMVSLPHPDAPPDADVLIVDIATPDRQDLVVWRTFQDALGRGMEPIPELEAAKRLPTFEHRSIFTDHLPWTTRSHPSPGGAS